MNQVPADVGDGLMHFFIAQASWSDAHLMLDHWGKPLFTLLSSPFAQSGFYGYVSFNVIVFAITVILSFKIFNHSKVSDWLQGLFPLILLTANDVVETITGGLTEPLFNLFLVLSIYLLIRKKWILFAIFISFMPFLRSEGQLPVVLALIILSYNKQWKSLPFLLMGFVLYALVGTLILGDFWWYFTQSPYYMANDIYGSGKWDHYLISYRNFIGNPGLYLIILGLPMSLFLLFKKQWNRLNFDATFLAYGTFIGVVVLHSYFWATGQNGSMGLTRIATQGATAFLMMQLIFISYYPIWKKVVAMSIGLLGFVGIALSLMNHKEFPNQINSVEQLAVDASNFAQKHRGNHKVFYFFPLIGYELGHNLKLESDAYEFYIGTYFDDDIKTLFKPGDQVIWDSHFSPLEGTLPLNKLEECEQFTLIHIGASGGNEIRVYQFGSTQNSEIQQLDFEDKTITISNDQEFVDVFSTEELRNLKTFVELEVSSNNEQLRFVIDNGQPEGYHSINTSKNSKLLTHQMKMNNAWRIYVWNPDKVEGTVNVSAIKTFDLKTN